MNVGILHAERADMDKLLSSRSRWRKIWTVPDSPIWDMSSAPTTRRFHWPFMSFTGKSFQAAKVDCWCAWKDERAALKPNWLPSDT